jgi:hypothetical protein
MLDLAALRRDADESARLGQSIPPEIEQVARGEFPKNLNMQAKQIEKLSKRLRRGIGQWHQ